MINNNNNNNYNNNNNNNSNLIINKGLLFKDKINLGSFILRVFNRITPIHQSCRLHESALRFCFLGEIAYRCTKL